MPLSLEQVQIQTQKLVMTPQMQLSIKLLQMNTLEIEQLAQKEILENPFLEIDEEREEETANDREETPRERDDKEDEYDVEYSESTEVEAKSAKEEKPAEKKEKTSSEQQSEDSGPSLDTNEGAETFDQVDVNWDEEFDDIGPPPMPNMREHPEEERDFTEYTALRESLYDKLMWQLRVSALEDKDLEIGEFIVGDLDANGYLTSSVEEIAEALKAPAEDVERVLSLIQTFDPTGVAARSLSECLLIQLESRGITGKIYKDILEDHFTKLGQQKFKEIAKAIGVEEEDVVKAFQNIRRCDPKPGRSITKESPRYVEPDIFVKKVDGRYLYFLNEGDLSHLRINEYYRNILQKNDALKDQDRDYYKDRYRSAVWLIRNIERRKGTILRVTEAIMDYQRDFLEKGPEHIRPLTLKQIAETVGMHEATIARVTSNKYVETPRGVFLLKYFFSSSLDRNDGRSASSRSVKEIIRKMIAEENPDKPLSDSAITKLLKERGVKIARRTVAKYRDQLKILPANLRRKVKQE